MLLAFFPGSLDLPSTIDLFFFFYTLFTPPFTLEWIELFFASYMYVCD